LSARASTEGGKARPSALAVIDYEFVFLRRLHRKFGRFLALQDAIDVSCCGSKGFFHAGTIGNQATSGDEVTERIDGGQPMLGKKSSNLLSRICNSGLAPVPKTSSGDDFGF
jgi:hypothetical protein